MHIKKISIGKIKIHNTQSLLKIINNIGKSTAKEYIAIENAYLNFINKYAKNKPIRNIKNKYKNI